MADSKESLADRIRREMREDAADRQPVTVRRRDGSVDQEATNRLNGNNAAFDDFKRMAQRRGKADWRHSEDPETASVKRAAEKVAGYKKGGAVKGGSARGDGCAMRGKTKGKLT